MTTRFLLNGEPVEADVAPHTTLLDHLRQSLRLTGTKEGCAEGDCGACTVALLDTDREGRPLWRAINSCLTLVPMLEGREVVTVEGLDVDGEHPVQQALVEALGSQCGYCTPGVVMTLFEGAYRSNLTDADIDDQLCGNLCRCTGYRPIRQAAVRTAGTVPVDRFSRRLTESVSRPAAHRSAHQDHRWVAPDTLESLLALLAEEPEAQLVAGATDLGLWVTKRRMHWPLLVSVERVPELHRLEAGQTLHIGAAVPLTDLEAFTATHCPPVSRMLRYFGSRQIKHRATVGGNLCNASPIGDLAPVLLALDAHVHLASAHGVREVPLDEFFLGYRQTALQPGEVLTAVRIPPQPEGARTGAWKVSRRREMDISAVALGGRVVLADGRVASVRLAYGGMAATPARASALEAALVGRPWTEAGVEPVLDALGEDFQPLSDHRGSAWYRSRVARNLVLGFVAETQSEAFRALPSRPLSTIVEAR